MKQLLIGILEQFCPNNVFLQGTLTENEAYPAEFITFWTNFTADRAHFDNNVHSVDWNFSIIYYSSNQSYVDTKPALISAQLKAAGFIPQGKGNDIPSDDPAFTGWAMNFIYTEKL